MGKYRVIGESDGKREQYLLDTLFLLNDKNKTKNKLTAAVIDVETNGLDYQKNKIIELGYIIIELDAETGEPIRILKEFNELQDPEEPLSDIIIQTTGITDEDLKGKSIDFEKVNKDFEKIDFCICHNSQFDRPFLEKKVINLRDKKFACSIEDIQWDEYNFPSKKLEFLAMFHGFYYDAHRALVDCKATLHLLSHKDPNNDEFYLKQMVEKLESSEFIVAARKTPFESKSYFKENQYLWQPELKIWYKYFSNEDEANLELSELKTSVYDEMKFNAEKVGIPLELKYKSIITLIKKEIEEENYQIVKKDSFKFSKPFVMLAAKWPFDLKDKLKQRGYSWEPNKRVWYLYVNEEEAREEKKWLCENGYPEKIFQGKIVENKQYKKEND